MARETPCVDALHGRDTYDVVVVGGGAAGIGAAIGARQANPSAHILLVESESCLGGAATHRTVVSYCGLFTIETCPRKAVAGVWDDIFGRLRKLGGTREKPDRHRGIFQVVEPECLKLVLDDMLNDHNIDVLLRTTVIAATNDRSSISAVDLQEKGGRRSIYAKAFIDCSGDCDLAYLAGASTRYGNHGTINLGSLATRFGGIAKNAKPTAAAWRAAILEAKAQDPSLHKICRKNASVLLKLPQSGDIVSFLASETYDGRDSASITAAEISGRRQARKYLDILRNLPGHENMYLVSTGPNFGIRESRHLNAAYRLREEDLLQNTAFEDTIALGAWGMEFHDEMNDNWESTFKYPPHGTFEIPLRCLRSIDTRNLFAAGRCVDADQYAGSAIRVMGTALATGHAAGVAASIYARSDGACDVNARDVQACLQANGALLDAAALPDAGLATKPA